jgi:serine protease Do
MTRRVLIGLWLLLWTAIGFAQGKDLPDFTDLVEKQGPAVVNISTTQVLKAPHFNHPFPLDEDDPNFDLFRHFLPHQMPGMPKEYKSQSLGSGFIISGDGYIITNAHVVDGADEVLVRLTDKREFKARIVGADRKTDIALLKIEARSLPVVQFGDPNRLRVGEWVVAIGAPFGFDNSVTAGIVSAKGRSLPQENYVPFIQTDVAINPGNSGGPLFNMKGEVVGVNSQIYSRSGGYMGLSFAIPIDLAMDVQNQLRATGRVSRGRIGVAIQEVTKELADSFGLAKAQGALVASVEKGSPADKAGVEAGDVILKFDGKTVSQSADLPRMVGSTRPGTRSQVEVWRKGASRSLAITVAEIPDDKGVAKSSARGKEGAAAPGNRLGLVVSELTAEQKSQLALDHGLIVEDLRGDAARSELRPGDVLLALVSHGAQTDLRSAEQLNGLLARLDKSATVTLLVRRGDAQTFVTLKGVGG